MKKLFLILTCILTLVPTMIFAKNKSYETMNLEESLKQEEIKYDLSSYKETDDQVIIYLFRGKGCPHCQDFLEFLNSIVPEYGKYFKVVSYESWYDEDNWDLMEEVSTFIDGKAATGVPYIIIGEQTYGGYASQYDDSIKASIMKEYNSKDRYDVFKAMDKAERNAKMKALMDDLLKIVPSIIFVIAGTVVILLVSKKQNEKIMNKLDSMELKIKDINVKENIVKKEEKKETKTKTKTTKAKK